MENNRRDQSREEDKNRIAQQDNKPGEGRKETGGEQKPDDRLKDGTNDFQNGDQNEMSEGTSRRD